ncbi:MAG: DUF2953 domain-containing protein [Sarcina sp.]
MFVIFIVLIVIFILLFPIKIKLTIFFDGKNFNIKIFKFNILNLNISTTLEKFLNKENTVEEKNISEKIENVTKEKRTKEKKKKEKKKSFFKKFSLNISSLISNLINNKFKMKIILQNHFEYSTEDAALTAFFYGILNCLFYGLYNLIDLFFFLEIKENTIEPNFNNQYKINFSNKSIIKTNLVQIIIILAIILKNLKFKGGIPKGNNYGK